MGLVEAVQVVAIAATAVVTCAAIDVALACHWLGRQAPVPIPADDRPPVRG